MSSSLNEATASLTANAALIRRSVFPVELLPVVAVLSNLVNFLLSVPILIGALLVARALGHPVGGPWIVLLPLVVALHLPFLCGMALGLAALAVHFKDVRDLVSNLLTLAFFLTPILYPVDAVPQSRPARAGRVEPGDAVRARLSGRPLLRPPARRRWCGWAWRPRRWWRGRSAPGCSAGSSDTLIEAV